MKTSLQLLFALTAVATAHAQSPAALPARFDLRQAHGVCVDDAGVPWAVGYDYKARFADGAMEFVPALGPSSPHNQPLTYRLQTIAVGAQVLHTAEAANAPLPAVAGNRVTFARGSVAERYDAMPAGVEQSFLLATQPPGEGDLIVRGAIATALSPQQRADGTLHFTDGRCGGVTIGTVTGIDARGVRCPGSMTLADGVLELRLPAAFVASAAYPLVLDPLFGATLLPGSTGFDDSEVATAYEESFGIYLVAWRRSSSATDQDLRAQRIGNDGSFVGSVISITNTSTSEIRPVVAAINQRNRFVVAWQSGGSPFGPWSVLARSIAADTGVQAATVTVASSGIDPAICGDRSQTGSAATIAWHAQGTGIRARTATCDAAGVLTLGSTNTLASATDVWSGPKLGKSNVPGGVTVVTWETAPVTGNSLFARAVDHAATAVGAITPIVIGNAGAIEHAVDGDGQQFVVANHDTQLYCARLAWNGAALAFVGSTSVPNSAGGRAPAIGWLGDRYLVAWQQPGLNPFDSAVKARALDANCSSCGLEVTVADVGSPNQRTPAIATHWAASSSQQDALLAWDETTTTAPFQGNVAAQRWQRMAGAPPVVLSPGCGGGTAGTDGPFALGNQQFRFTLSGGDPTAPIAILSLADGSLAPATCGCTFTQPLVAYAMLAVGGAADHLFPLPCGPQLLGVTIEAQWLQWGAAASPCAFVPNLVASERLLLTLTQ